jgi:RNA recognition motif-containing protein
MGRLIFVREDRDRANGRPNGVKPPTANQEDRKPPHVYFRDVRETPRRNDQLPVADKPGATASAAGRRVFVGNIAYSATEAELADFMNAAGDVTLCEILPEKGTANGSKGCAVVEYAKKAEAEKAIKQLSELKFKGRAIFVRADNKER